jgi:uncharacterized protein YegP (UPF0339 family)
MKITVNKAEHGYRWRARAANGEIVSESGEAYQHKSYVLEAARRFGPAGAELEFESEFEEEFEEEFEAQSEGEL